MLLLKIEGADALLQCEERLVDLSAVHLRLLIRVHSVCATLTSRQIDKADLSIRLPLVFQLHLQDGVRARAVGIGTGLAGGTTLQARRDVGHDLFCSNDGFFSETHNINLLLGILSTRD